MLTRRGLLGIVTGAAAYALAPEPVRRYFFMGDPARRFATTSWWLNVAMPNGDIWRLNRLSSPTRPAVMPRLTRPMLFTEPVAYIEPAPGTGGIPLIDGALYQHVQDFGSETMNFWIMSGRQRG